MPQPVQYRGMALIVPDNDSEWKEFYEHARAHRLVVRKCKACGLMRYPPTHACPWCMELGWTWQEVSGRGTIYSYEIVAHAIQPGFREQTPYAVVLIELDEQRGQPTPDEALRVIANLVKADFTPEAEANVAVGRRVRVVFQDLAERMAPTLAVISTGRLSFGAGPAYGDVETVALGHDPKGRVGRLVEGLELVERLWRGEPVTYEGRHFSLRGVRISMRPLQNPRPPIWLAANGDAGVRRAARLGDAWLMNPHATLATLERQLELFRGTRRELGRPPAIETPMIKECYVAPDAATAFAEAAAFIGPKYSAYRSWEQDKALPPGETFDASFGELARDRFIIGDPTRVVEEIVRCRERLGVTTMIFRVQWPGMEQEKVLRSIRLLGQKVLLKFLSS